MTKKTGPDADRESDYLELDKELMRALPARRRYFARYAGDIANQNFETVKLMSGITVLFTLLFVGVAWFLIPSWTITPAHIILCAAMIIVHLISVNCPREKRREYLFSTAFTMVFLVIALGAIVAIDLLTTGAAVFLPTCFVVFGVTLLLPFSLSLSVMGVAELVFVLIVMRVKAPEVAMMDVFASLFGLAASVTADMIVSTVITRESTNSRQYKQLSRIDALTGVLNKGAARVATEQYLLARETNEQCALLVFDIDNFKQINDTYGHKKGDETLEKIGDILKESIRERDIAGRFGGDEFTVLLKGVRGRDVLEKKCGELRALVRRKAEVDCSIGAAWIRTGSYSFETVFRAADDALYASKAAGKGRWTIREVVKAAKKTVLLIVDDDFAARLLLRGRFEKNYDIMEADSGEQALTLLAHYQNRIGAVLLRMDMPGTDGYEVLKKIREKMPYDALPVIAVTNGAQEEKRVLLLGANDQISLPYDLEIVRIRVDNAVRSTHAAM